MPLSDLEKALKRFSDRDGACGSIECSDASEVRRVAQELGLLFPASVNAFYERYECMYIGPDEFNPLERVAEEYNALRGWRFAAPVNYVPILTDGTGGFYYVVCKKARSEPSDFGCVMLQPGYEPQELEYKSHDFLAFMISRVEFWEEDL